MAMVISSQEFGAGSQVFSSVVNFSDSFIPNMPRVERQSSTFYKVESFKKHDYYYDVIFNDIERRWRCACYDARAKQANNKKYACKHILALRSFIKEQEAMRPGPAPTTPAPAPAPADEARMDSLEAALYAMDAVTNDRIDRQDRRIQSLESALQIKQDEIDILQDQRDIANGLINKLLMAQEAMQAKLDALQSQVAELAKIQPVAITTQEIIISGPVQRAGSAGDYED